MVSQRKTVASEDELLVLAEVAQLYYVKDLTQEQIAQRIGASRSNVSRMLKEARGQGMVEIKIHSPLKTAPALQERLALRLGLEECRVLADVGSEPRAFEDTDTATQVAALAARYLLENIAEGDVVCLGWGRSMHRVVHNRFLRGEADVTVVQIMGSIGGSIPEFDGVATTARLASVLGTSAHYLHAPMLVTDSVVRDGLMRDPHVRRTLEVARNADTAMVSVGTIGQENGLYQTGYLSEEDLGFLQDQGVVGEICGTYFAGDGSIIPQEMNERSISISPEELKSVSTRIGVSSGSEKPLANIGAALSGLLNVLITDENTARNMLDILDAQIPATR